MGVLAVDYPSGAIITFQFFKAFCAGDTTGDNMDGSTSIGDVCQNVTARSRGGNGTLEELAGVSMTNSKRAKLVKLKTDNQHPDKWRNTYTGQQPQALK